MVPAIFETVGRRKEWRAVIVCDESGLNQKNPFDLVTELPTKLNAPIGTDANSEIGIAYEAHQKAEHEKKLRAYEQASKNALTRLVTFLCDAPTATMPENALDCDTEYQRYVVEIQRKQELRAAILKDEHIETSKPTEVICVAKRTCPEVTADYGTVWESHDEEEYSRFYDRNMYFDRMRYLIFDILPRDQRNYKFDYIRFLYATMLLAANDVPGGCLSAKRIYQLVCDTDEEALRRLLYSQEAKLNLTEEYLNQRIYDIQRAVPKRLSDREAKNLFGSSAMVPVLLDENVELDKLYVKDNRIGLANGCPREEESVWEGEYYKSKKEFALLLKHSRRSLKRATKGVRDNEDPDLSNVQYLNEYQLEDAVEYIDNEEKTMVENIPPDLYNEEIYYKKLSAENKAVRNKVRQRMYRNSTLVVGALALLAFALGFFTLFINVGDSDLLNLSASGIILLVAIGVMVVTIIATLFYLRWTLVRLFKRYNRTMHGIYNDIHGAMEKCSTYLGHICNVRRGFAILNASSAKEDPARAKVILYRKHITDIKIAKAKTREIFGHFMTEPVSGAIEESEYDYDFNRPVEYDYPFPYNEERKANIDFMQPGLRVPVPVDFVKSLTVRREEIYD